MSKTVMKKGRELDADVAEKVMGWRLNEARTFYDVPGTEEECYGGVLVQISLIPPFSTDIAAAWEVVEKMREQGYDFCIEGLSFVYVADVTWREDGEHRRSSARAATAPLAICRAALSALRDR